MPLLQFSARDFRCLIDVEFTPDPHYNLIYGANASGKTSLLEAIGYLGRGRSFRGASTQQLVRHGAESFLLRARVETEARSANVGVQNGVDGLEISVDGDRNGGAAGLATILPLQIVDPDVHNLVSGGPEQRRRYLDWIAFHVEHGYLELWRRFRRALKQRNAALRDGLGGEDLSGWSRELADSGLALHEARRSVLEISAPVLEEIGADLLGSPVRLDYRQGWSESVALLEALRDGVERDRQLGSTQAGPHRADLGLFVDDRRARKRVSRGQQKLLACTLILGATEVVQVHRERPLLLLLDDPAAELDAESLGRLMARVIGLGCQVIATALEPDSRLFPEPPALFHVEQGALEKLA